jgi:hypothetical protein
VDKRRNLPELVASVEGRIRTAQSQWDASSAARCEECCETLEIAVLEMRELQAEAARTRSAPLGPVGRGLSQIKADVARVAGKVDAATAFCRGMAGVIGLDGAVAPASDSGLRRGSEGQA